MVKNKLHGDSVLDELSKAVVRSLKRSLAYIKKRDKSLRGQNISFSNIDTSR